MVTDTLDGLKLLKAREAARLLDVSVRTLDRLVEAKRIQPIRLKTGGTRRFRATDLAALVAGDTKED